MGRAQAAIVPAACRSRNQLHNVRTARSRPASGARGQRASHCQRLSQRRHHPLRGRALAPAYQPLADALGKALNCKVELNITTNYTAEIEAMRADNLEIAEFGPLAYVFAQKLAKAELVATFSDADGNPATYHASIVTWPGSGVTDLTQLGGHSFAYSDPASASGHLFPAFGLASNGIDPDTGVQALYAGSHTSFPG